MAKTIRPRGVLNLAQIKQRIPHRHPFLFLDRVISLEAGKRGVGLKCVSGNEEVFNGHFPDEPIFPGALIIESAAQMAAITLTGKQKGSPPQGMLLSVESFRFLHPVVPGDTMIIETRILKTLGSLVKVSAEVKVEELIVARGELALLQQRTI